MKYHDIYDRLIERARNRTLKGYVERHHVKPRCLGGTDEESNIVKLTPEEHYVAHQLLVKMHPTNIKLASAVTMFGASTPGRKGSKVYGWLRRHLSQLKTGSKGTPLTAEHKAKLSAALKGKSWGKLTEEQKAKLSAARTGLKIKRTPEHNAKISEANKGKKFPGRCHIKEHTEETKKKIAEKAKGRVSALRLPWEQLSKYAKNNLWKQGSDRVPEGWQPSPTETVRYQKPRST